MMPMQVSVPSKPLEMKYRREIDRTFSSRRRFR
jgi:hypothetical protein